MNANFKVVKDSTIEQGTYSETWVSREKWRAETLIGDFHKIEVVNSDKRWISDTFPPDVPQVRELGLRMTDVSIRDVDKIEDRIINSVQARCIESHPLAIGGRTAVCVDKTTGLLFAIITAVPLGNRTVERTCNYSDYQNFSDKTVPRAIRCTVDNKTVFESTITELVTEMPNAALFAPLAGGKESTYCRDTPKPPQAVYTPDPVRPKHGTASHPVMIWLVVGTDGIPKDLKVIRSLNQSFDDAAMDAVRRWRFRPANCNGGQPLETQINVEINFQP